MGKNDPIDPDMAMVMKTQIEKYIEQMSKNLETMKKASATCEANMKSDRISRNMVVQLDNSLSILARTVDSASKLKELLKNELTDISSTVS